MGITRNLPTNIEPLFKKVLSKSALNKLASLQIEVSQINFSSNYFNFNKTPTIQLKKLIFLFL